MKRRIMSLTLASAMTLSMISGAFAETEETGVKTNKPYINGYEDGSFKPQNAVNRAEIAKMVTVIKELEKSVTSFPDVGEEHGWAKEFIGAAEKAGILKGDQVGNFRPQDGLTRAELATVVSRIIGNATGEGVVLSDISGHWGEADILNVAKAGIIKGYEDGTFKPDNKVTRQEAVKMLNGMQGRIVDVNIADKVKNPYSDIDGEWGKAEILAAGTDYKYTIDENGVESVISQEVVEEGIKSVTATGSRELTIAGGSASKIKMSDIKVDNNEVESIKLSEDKRSAIVQLKTMLEPGKETNVTVNLDGDIKQFTVTYSITEENLEVVSEVFDEDTKNQSLSIKLDGKVTDIDFLRNSGYTFEFNAYIGNESANYQVFGSGEASTSGIIGEQANGKSVQGKYDIVLTLKKGDLSVTSKRATINIVDFLADATAIRSVKMINDNGTGSFDNSQAFRQTSGTLVKGEQLNIESVIAVISRKEVELGKGSVAIDSNNNCVEIEGSGSNMKIVAKEAGEAEITVKVGKATKTYTFKVVDEKRVEAKVEAEHKTNGIIVGRESKAQVKITDQFGDPIRHISNDVEITYPTAIELAANGVISAGQTLSLNRRLLGSIDRDGKVDIDLGVAAKEGQTGSIIIKDTKGTIIGNIFVRSESAEVKSRKLVVSSDSDKKTPILAINSNDSITYMIEEYNVNGTLLGYADLTGYKFSGIRNSNGELVVKASFDNASGSIDSADVVRNSGTEEIKAITFKGAVVNTKYPVKVYSKENIEIGTIDFEIRDTTAILQGIRWKNVESIFSDANTERIVDLETLVTLEQSNIQGADPAIQGLTISGDDKSPKRAKFNKKGSEGSNQIRVMDIYLDKDNNGFFTEGDQIIGRIELTSDAMGVHLLGTNESPEFGAKITSAFSEGSLVYKLVSNDGTVISTKNVKIDGSLERYIQVVGAGVHELRAYIHGELSTGYLSDAIALGLENGSSSVLNATEETFIKPKSKWNIDNGTEGEGKLGENYYIDIRALKEKIDPIHMKDLYERVLAIEERLIQAEEQMHEAYRVSELAKFRMDIQDDRADHPTTKNNTFAMRRILAENYGLLALDATLGAETYYGPGAAVGTATPINDTSTATSTLGADIANRVYDASNLEMAFPFSSDTVKRYNLKGAIRWTTINNNGTISIAGNNTAKVADKPVYGREDLNDSLNSAITINNLMGQISKQDSNGEYAPVAGTEANFSYTLSTSIKTAADFPGGSANLNNGDVITSLADRVFYGKGNSKVGNVVKGYYTRSDNYGTYTSGQPRNIYTSESNAAPLVDQISDKTGEKYFFNNLNDGSTALGATTINGYTPTGVPRNMTYSVIDAYKTSSNWKVVGSGRANMEVATNYKCTRNVATADGIGQDPCTETERVAEPRLLNMPTEIGNIFGISFPTINDAAATLGNKIAMHSDGGYYDITLGRNVYSNINMFHSASKVSSEYKMNPQILVYQKNEYGNAGNENQSGNETSNLVELTIEWK